MLHLYDSKSARIQPLNPVTPGKVGIYLCGATVQGSPHVGHLRAAVSFDTLIRWLRRSGYEVTYVRNVTDIDDKGRVNLSYKDAVKEIKAKKAAGESVK